MPIATAKSATITKSTRGQYHVTAYAAASAAVWEWGGCSLRAEGALKAYERICGSKCCRWCGLRLSAMKRWLIVLYDKNRAMPHF